MPASPAGRASCSPSASCSSGARYQDDGEGALSRGAYLLLAVVGAMVCAGALIIGFIAMTKK